MVGMSWAETLMLLALAFVVIEAVLWVWREYVRPFFQYAAERPFMSIGVVVLALDAIIHIH
jgi:hypothetical protein